MQVKSQVPFIPEPELEKQANLLIDRYYQEIEPILSPPVPVEKIADFLLELGMEWIPIPDTDDEPILAYIHAESRTIRLNEKRQSHFDQYMGTYEYTLAHEIGHYLFHLTDYEFEQTHFDFVQGKGYLCRDKSKTKDKREWQAERFASYLLMPSSLLIPTIENINLLSWRNLYSLRDKFQVSITALKYNGPQNLDTKNGEKCPIIKG
jgi:hypothetical protein